MVESIETRRDILAVRGIDKRVVTETTNERGEIPSIDFCGGQSQQHLGFRIVGNA
jgi:hypothetical protein